MVYNDFISKLGWKKLQWKSVELTGNGAGDTLWKEKG